jgi:hypothetical protein
MKSAKGMGTGRVQGLRTTMSIKYSKESVVRVVVEFQDGRVRIFHALENARGDKQPSQDDEEDHRLMRQPCISDTPYM